MDDDFQEIINEEIRYTIIYELVQNILLEYNLKKMPENDSLYACLEVYTKPNLLKLAEKNGIDVRASWNKGPIIDALHDGIMYTVIERLLLLGEEKTRLLYQFSTGKFDTEEATPEKFDFFLKAYPQAVHMGLIYSFGTDNNVQMLMPLEIKAALAYFMKQNDEVKKRYQDNISTMKQIEEAFLAAVHLYGVIDVSRVRDLWEIQYPNLPYDEDFEVFFWSMIPLIAIKHDHYFINYRIIANYRLVEPEYAMDLYYHILDKMDFDYYVPSKKEIRYYAQYPFNQHSPTYKKMKRLVSKLTEDVEIALEFIEASIQLGEQISDILDEIQELDLIFFESDEQLFEFAELHTKLHNNARLWENGGYTPNELFNQLADSSFDIPENPQIPDNIIPLANYQRPADNKGNTQPAKKIGRNDPCPCGSGKKYKRCCWNK